MEYQCEVMINAKLDQVLNKFMSHEELFQWQEGLKRIVKSSKELNTYYLVYQEDGDEVVIKETIKDEDLPDTITLVYEINGTVNECKSTFIPYKNTIVWVMDVNFTFPTPHDVPKEMFNMKTIEDMEKFKAFVESES